VIELRKVTLSLGSMVVKPSFTIEWIEKEEYATKAMNIDANKSKQQVSVHYRFWLGAGLLIN
jgi:hypothetical protein